MHLSKRMLGVGGRRVAAQRWKCCSQYGLTLCCNTRLLSVSAVGEGGDKFKKKSKRAAKKAAFGSQKGVDITKRTENYAAWYSDVITAADMIDQSPVRGCMIMKPWSMEIWELIKTAMDKRIKSTGAKSVYFPLLVPLSFLSKEASHVEGFAKECAVVTHHRVRSDGDTLVPDEAAQLSDPLVIRPTSETIIWSTFSRWVQSYKDLPLKVNQWANVMRWEMRPRPFLRTSEFLWQEGHTAHSTRDEALALTGEMLRIYQYFCENILAMPVISGVKSECEKFAGAESTHTIEGLMQNGWALQCGTSHFLGTNFGEAFDVRYQSSSGELQPVWATSWGVSTRLIGGVIMTHSDDTGLVLPPFVAPVQVILVPLITASTSEEDAASIKDTLNEFASELRDQDVRCEIDDRDGNDIRPGAKFYEWERKGVPVRVVLGGKEHGQGTVTVKTRISTAWSIDGDARAGQSGAKGISGDQPSFPPPVAVAIPQFRLVSHVRSELMRIQTELYHRAKTRLASNTSFHPSYPALLSHVKAAEKESSVDSFHQESNSTGTKASSTVNTTTENESEADEEGMSTGLGFYLAPWRPHTASEKQIKSESKLTIRCFPDSSNFEPRAVLHAHKAAYDQIKRGELKCFFDAGETATELALFARNF